jgi:hypothetical protein
MMPSLFAICNGEAPQRRRRWVVGLSLRQPGAILANAGYVARGRAKEEIMTRQSLAVALAGALFGLIAAPVLAQNAGPAPATASKPKAPDAGATVTVMVTNSRRTDLVELQAAESGSVSWKKVLGALKAGKEASAKLPQPFNCRVNLHGTFADGQSMEASDFNICEQKTLNLTD